MSQMRKKVWSKLKSPFTKTGKSQKESVKSLVDKFNVNEEYMEVFRTKSYIEMWSKVQGQLRRSSLDRLSSSSSLPLNIHLSESLLEPQQETVIPILEGSNLYHLLVKYFEASQEACFICELLLQSVHQTRNHYRKIKRVIKLAKRVYDPADYTAIFKELSSFASLKNPFSVINAQEFHDIHDSHGFLLQRLTSKRRKVKRRAKFTRFCKKIGLGFVISYSALAIALLVLALHSVVGIVAAPGLIASCLFSVKRGRKLAKRGLKTRKLERLGAQLEVAAKGVYILINDFDTMSRLVRRLHDEIEHRRELADMCVRNGKSGVLKEVVGEFQIHESCFLEQLKELEDRIYLSLLTINKSRMLVIQEITVLQAASNQNLDENLGKKSPANQG
ncbi:hypothetical protein F0562_027094 [Nyssa sinensis]|uniref:Uncharacterized protein n=1 Tax=Nyssa sinensis TaxID=561372 RepID=A0A5J5B5F5_9ASTE|nr:hypothetical protein F0562_027094 [Nyssa sinensis]